MSDIQEEQKRLYKRAEENDCIVKDIAQYDETDSNLAKYTILELQDRIDKARKYIKEHSTTIDYKTMKADYNLNMNDLLDILGDNK